MTKAEIFDTIKRIVVDELNLQDENIVQLDANFNEDLRADSLALVEIIMKFEDKFGMEIKDEEAEPVKTIGDAVEMIYSKLQTSAEG